MATKRKQGLFLVTWKDEAGNEKKLHIRAFSLEGAIRKAKARAVGGISVVPIEGFVS
jgi:hypothetical protein